MNDGINDNKKQKKVPLNIFINEKYYSLSLLHIN